MRKIKPYDHLKTVLANNVGGNNLPTIRIDLTHIPEAKNWELGQTYEVDMMLKLTGISQTKYDNSAEFQLVEIEPEEAEGNDNGMVKPLASEGGIYFGKPSTTKTPSNASGGGSKSVIEKD